MTKAKNIEFQIAKLELRPGDILVVKSARPLSAETAARLRQILEQAVGGHRCMVLESGLDLSILTIADLQALLAKSDIGAAA
jgi:hypothetical protein